MRRKLERLYRYMVYAISALLLLVLFINLAVYSRARPYIYTDLDRVPEAQAALVPGAAVKQGGKLSSILKERVDAALALYRGGKVSKILISGDNSSVEYNEVNPVKDYLIGKGVPDGDIFLDHAGFDTYSTMYRARDIFEAKSLIITSQAFHLPRAVFIARSLGIMAYGYGADIGRPHIKNYMRELLANEKAVLDVLISRKPKYLGEAIPLEP